MAQRPNGERKARFGFCGKNDYVDLQSPAVLDDLPTKSYSAFTWVNRSNTTDYKRIIDKRVTGAGWSFYTRTDGNIGVLINGITVAYETSGWNISTGVWHHVGFTYDQSNGNLKIYIDGTIAAQKTAGTTYGATDASLNMTIGARGDGAALYFGGQIDEVKIFNYALTPAQVKTEMAGGAIRFE